MILTILSIVLFLVFSVLSGFHFYWLMGGKYGVTKVIPTKGVDAVNTQAIPPIATLIVALVLLSFGAMYLLSAELLTFGVPNWIMQYGPWFVPSIFILRAIGEFKYVGFFKRIKDTEFAKADTRLFSPLCLGIGLIGFLIPFLS